jgi:hypothetical protein
MAPASHQDKKQICRTQAVFNPMLPRDFLAPEGTHVIKPPSQRRLTGGAKVDSIRFRLCQHFAEERGTAPAKLTSLYEALALV